MPALTTEQVLIEEAAAIHGADLKGKTGTELDQSLYALNSAALCLSGGGIRSAAFALGVIQSLASHPRPSREEHVADGENCFLSRFHYLSTVSGGGYIGGWLSAWVTRAGFPTVWRNLVGRPDGSEIEPQAVAWLRSYSNFLTPKLGVFSGDAWAALAIILRNIILNWFVILPVFVLGLLLAKLYAILVAWFSQFSPRDCEPTLNATAIVGAGALFVGLWFIHSHRPSHSNSSAAQGGVLVGTLLPSIAAGLFFSFALALPCAHDTLRFMPWFSWPGPSKLITGLFYGVLIYILAWVAAFPWWEMWRPVWDALLDRDRRQNVLNTFPGVGIWRDVGRDVLGVLVAGAIFGILMALVVQLYFAFFWEAGVWKFKRSEILLVLLAVPWTLASLLLAEIIFVGLTNREKNSDSDREWLARVAGFYLSAILVWIVVVFLVFLAATVADDIYERVWPWITGIASGSLAAWLGKNPATPAKGPAKSVKGLSANLIIVVAAVIFGILLIVMTSAVLDRVLLGGTLIETAAFRGRVVESGYPDWPTHWQPWLGLAVALAAALIASAFVNINRFSLHALYRNRLIRAFLGASHAEQRKPNPFTDFDDADNLRMHELWPPERLWAEVRGKSWQPFHVVNIALNIVSTKRLAWQERKAETFTVTPLHSGSACGQRLPNSAGMLLARGAYRASDSYGGSEGISLGTAVAISGAAASPNMGYHSSPPLAFLMTLFNVRLGWWLGNPDKDKPSIYQSEGPNWAIGPLANELLGRTTDDKNFVSLSDGGHFENLGLYEMVRRRCKLIVISDAACDADFAFADLGNAVRKIALDLGVPITFRGVSTLRTRAAEDSIERSLAVRERAGIWRFIGRDVDLTASASQEDDGTGGWRISGRKLEFTAGRDAEDEPLYAIGSIDYGSGRRGLILYVKAAYHKDLVKNVGVRSYAIANPEFPHQSTADQWFSESQFESYRALGMELMDDILERGTAFLPNPSKPILDDVFTALEEKAMNDPRP